MLIDYFFRSANLAKLTNLEVEINFKNYLQNIQKLETKKCQNKDLKCIYAKQADK